MVISLTGAQSIRNSSLEQLKQLLEKAGHSDLDTPETGALMQSEFWETAIPTLTTLSRATMWGDIWKALSALGLTESEMARAAKLALTAIYPESEWTIIFGNRGQMRLQAKMRLEP